MTLLVILQIVGLLLIGCAMRFILPYILVGFEAVGRENTWRAWPPWEWRYLTSLILSLIGYGVMMVLIPETLAKWAAMAPVQVIIFSYSGQDVAGRLYKPLRNLYKLLTKR